MKINSVDKLIEHLVQDLYDGENQTVAALPRLAENATDADLKNAFEMHMSQTNEHVKRLESVAESLEITLGNTTCYGMQGLLKEGEEAIKNVQAGPLLDAALIGGAQKVEHYEIAAYEDLIMHLDNAGDTENSDLLQETLNEEEETSEKLGELAEAGLVESSSTEDLMENE